jgi:ankyrin repeat protein
MVPMLKATHPCTLAAYKGHTALVQLLLDAHADTTSVNLEGSTPLRCAALGGHTQAVQLLLTAPQLTMEVMTNAAKAAATAGHAELANVMLRAVMARDIRAAAQLLGEEALAANVLRQLQAAEANVREQEARWPALQQLLIGIAGSHQQLQAAAADITACAVSAAMQAAHSVSDQAMDAAVEAAATNAALATAVRAPLASDITRRAAAAAAAAQQTGAAAPAKALKRAAQSGLNTMHLDVTVTKAETLAHPTKRAKLC